MYFGHTFCCANPQFNIWIDGIFNEHRNIYTAQCIGYILHAERVYGSTGTNPQHINTKMQCIFCLL